MDLLSTVRKEGSRGGRAEFKWSDVSSSSHRENYLGHSLMAPVGRWQKGRDLNWYAKADGEKDENGETGAERDARQRGEELRKIKETEQDAMAKALGLPVPQRNPNMESLGDRREVNRVLKESQADRQEGGNTKGIGFGVFGGATGTYDDSQDRIEGNAEAQDAQMKAALRVGAGNDVEITERAVTSTVGRVRASDTVDALRVPGLEVVSLGANTIELRHRNTLAARVEAEVAPLTRKTIEPTLTGGMNFVDTERSTMTEVPAEGRRFRF